MAVTETIQELLQGIDDSQYGRDMRQYIHKGIQKCYEEGSAGETDLTARNDIADINATIAEILGNFGSVESTSTASRAYTKGDIIVYENRLYKATAAIAQGDTLTVGGNIEDITVAGTGIKPANFANTSTVWSKDAPQVVDYLHTCQTSGWYMLSCDKAQSNADCSVELSVDAGGTMVSIAEVYNTAPYASKAMTPWFYFEEGQTIRCNAHIANSAHGTARLWYAPCL